MTRTTLAIAAALLAAPAFASVEDTNGDGMYSFEEVLVSYPALTEETFHEYRSEPSRHAELSYVYCVVYTLRYGQRVRHIHPQPSRGAPEI